MKNVTSWSLVSFENGDLFNLSDRAESEYYSTDAYLNGEKIADAASLEWYDEEKNEFVLVKDQQEENHMGTLVYYKDGQETEIDTKVYSGRITKAGDLMYIKNLDEETWKGDLYLYRDGESELIAKRVHYVDPELDYSNLAG